MFIRYFPILATFVILISIHSCNTISNVKKTFDIQGHRGCRGLLPENTLPAFKKALYLGVTTLELDLAISADNQVVVSHEPFFNHEITSPPEGLVITKENETNFNLNRMDYDSIKQYDVGMKPLSRFLDQKKMKVCKPLLKEVMTMAQREAKTMGRTLPFYNIEIKSKPEWDEKFYPSIEKFVDLTVDVLDACGTREMTFIQSFDPRALQYVNEAFPDISTVFLIENDRDLEQNLAGLGFTPDVYSPYYKQVDKSMVDYCHKNKMLLIPWTVNDEDDMIALIHLGVDGIISDYPDLLIEVHKNIIK